jgi:hypothetical protein
MRTSRFARLPLVALLAGQAACGTTEPDFEPVVPDGIWQSSTSGLFETTLQLNADGSAALVEADLSAESCGDAVGTWDADQTTLRLILTPSGGAPSSDRRTYAYEAFADSLVLTDDGNRTVFRPRAGGRTCVDYGWGSWEGTLSAEVDGAARTFGAVRISMAIAAGRLEITSYAPSCDTCALGDPELVLRIDGAPDPLGPRTFVVDNVPGARNTFFGFHHTHPGDPDFLGFNTDRLSPTGTFTLQAIAPDRVRATFSFRGNPIVEGQQAPDGRTTVLVTGGVVDLTYR